MPDKNKKGKKMRTSGQLTKKDMCVNNNNASVSVRADNILQARIQKEVLRQFLNGEIEHDPDSVREALMLSFMDNDLQFENRYQQEALIRSWADRIIRYGTWEQRDLTYPERGTNEDGENMLYLPDVNGNRTDTVVNIFGEDVKVVPDYITRNGNAVTIGKIKTGATPGTKAKLKAENEQYEIYAYGLLGKKLYPGAQITVELDHLADTTGEVEHTLMHLPYEPDEDEAHAALLGDHASGTYYDKRRQILFTDDVQKGFEERHAAEEMEDSVEVTEDCATCPKFNICNYSEPPISMDTELSVRPISEIHLTEEQQAAVDYRHGTVRINAGAGAGKTLVVAWRVKEMLKEGVRPEEILLTTFTNAGANEMKARVEDYCEAEGIEFDHEKLQMSTINAFCQTIIDDHYEELGFSRPPRIIPKEVQLDRINQILSRYPKVSIFNYTQQYTPEKYRNDTRALLFAEKFFEVIKEQGYTREDNPWNEGKKKWDKEMNRYLQIPPEDLDLIFTMYEDYDHTIKAEDRIEYPDQLNLVEKLYEMHPDLFDNLGKKHIIVDEFQDTDLPQIKLLQQMKDASCFESLMCVGDDSQAIFSFRHTSPEYLINFAKYLGDGNEATGYRCDNINLVENHRSTANIIDFANSINRLNVNRVDKDLIATKDYADPVEVRGYYSKHQEYVDIAKQIKEDIDNGTKPYDIAFLAYTKKELNELAGELTKLGVGSVLIVPQPYLSDSNCAAAQTFFDSFVYGTTQGIMDYINAKGKGSLIGLSASEIEEKVSDFKESLNGENLTVEKFIEYVRALDPEGKDECLNSFIEKKLEPCRDIEEMKDLFRAMKIYGEENDFKREGRSAEVCLSTIHSAKGLEWDKVYYSVDGLDKEKFHKGFNSNRCIDEKEENNRMHFVAASRARSECHCAGVYTIDTSPQSGYPVNNYLKSAFEIIGKPFVFQTSQIRAVRAQENRANKAAEEAERRRVPRTPSHEMTLDEYRAMTENAHQINMFDYDNQRD